MLMYIQRILLMVFQYWDTKCSQMMIIVKKNVSGMYFTNRRPCDPGGGGVDLFGTFIFCVAWPEINLQYVIPKPD